MMPADVTADDEPVLAAGAVVWRETEDRRIEVCLVHRPKYDDWSLPKGKTAPGEHVLSCAAREVAEETGHDVVLGRPLPTQHYQAEGRPKRVLYWLAAADSQAPPRDPDAEIDDVVFVPVPDALELLTQQRDADLVAAAMRGPLRTTPLVLIRHAKAMPRHEWAGADSDRPLDAHGAADAAALTAPLATLGIRRVVSSDAVRCVDTVRPFADGAQIAVEIEAPLSEEYLATADHPHPASRLVWSLQRDGSTLVCSHRPVLPVLFDAAHVTPPPELAPGGFVVVHEYEGAVVAVDRHAP